MNNPYAEEKDVLPNSLASTGPYAGLWSHLKSMDYALGRVLASDQSRSKLDEERLTALAEFLRSGLLSNPDPSENPLSLLISAQPKPNDYSAGVDLRKVIDGVPEFKHWRQSAKKKFDEMLQRLIDLVEQQAKPHELFLLSNPQLEEFQVLRVILQTLLTDAEADM